MISVNSAKTNLPHRMRMLAFSSVALMASLQPGLADAASCFRGINLAGAEFGEGNVYEKDYKYPSEETITHFAEKGFTSVRLPFRWERLQPRLNKPFDEDELARLQETVELIKDNGMSVVIDPHNYARYEGKVIGTSDVPDVAFADFWHRLAQAFANDEAVSFALMNEPHDVAATQWLKSANTAIAAIRTGGARNLILVPGTSWTGAHSWRAELKDGSNATVMAGIKDPASNYAYEVHQYLDSDFSGHKGTCSRGADAIKALEDFTLWLRNHGQRGYLGEFGAPAGKDCLSHLTAMTKVVEENRDIWVGWAYWAAGDWWPAEEPLNIQPVKGVDKPQLSALTPILNDRSKRGLSCPALER